MSALPGPLALLDPPLDPVASSTRRRAFKWSDLAFKSCVVATSGFILVLAWWFHSGRDAMQLMMASTTGRGLLYAGGLYGSLSTIWTFWRLYLAIRYRPFPVVEDHCLPRITVVVPAYNEGRLVGETIRHIAKADYPRHLLEIIAVDDGSDDDTWTHIEAAARQLGDVVSTVRCPRNRGKRWALYEGFRRGSGSVYVTVDSDSLIARDSLKALVSPLVLDPRIGGVAGNVRVLNRDEGLIPRMMAVRYVMTFDYKRAAQSMMGGGAVLCCAGALAAYRRSAVEPVLDRWLHQTFRGSPARAGEDHAMTNFILGQGYKVCYQRTARVETKTPITYTGLCKMFLRWGRSNVRETVHTGRYVFTRFRDAGLWGIRFNYLMCAVGLILPYFFLVSAILLSIFLPTVFGLKLLASCVIGSSFTVLFFLARERRSDALYGVPYGFYSTFLLWWIWPYALLTCNKSIWLTRTAATRKTDSPRRPQPGRTGSTPPQPALDLRGLTPQHGLLAAGICHRAPPDPAAGPVA